MRTISLKTAKFRARVYVVFAMMLGVTAIIIFSAFEKKEVKEIEPNESRGLQVEVSHPVFEKITEWDEC